MKQHMTAKKADKIRKIIFENSFDIVRRPAKDSHETNYQIRVNNQEILPGVGFDAGNIFHE